MQGAADRAWYVQGAGARVGAWLHTPGHQAPQYSDGPRRLRPAGRLWAGHAQQRAVHKVWVRTDIIAAQYDVREICMASMHAIV